MASILSNAVFVIQLIAAETGLILYLASFFGYRLEDGSRFLTIACISIALSSIPATIRDRRFFLKNWGFGLLAIRYRFPFQFFPARRVEWLNQLAWCFTIILLLHFAWLVMSTSSQGILQNDTRAALRYAALIVTFSGILTALSWKYPPTEMPQRAEDHQGIDA